MESHPFPIRRWCPGISANACTRLVATILRLPGSPAGRCGRLLVVLGLVGVALAEDLPLDLVKPKGHVGDIIAVAYTPDGKTLVTAGTDRLAKLWDVAAAGVRADLKGHEGAIRALAVSPDGKTIATGGDDRVIRLWSAKDGASLGKPVGTRTTRSPALRSLMTATRWPPAAPTAASGCGT